MKRTLDGHLSPIQRAVVGGGIVHDGDNVSSKHLSIVH